MSSSLRVRLAAASLFCIPLAGCLDSQGTLSSNELSVSAAVAVAAVPCVGNQALPRVQAIASTNESPSLLAPNAIDGNPATRWSSAFFDPQWIRIDLGAVRFISAVTLRWEAASAQRYDIQVSHDGISWKSVQTMNWGQPGPIAMPFTGLNARGRYLRVYTYTRTTPYGVSLYEVEARGDLNGGCSEPSAVRIDAVHSGKSLDVKDWSTAPGGLVQQWGYGNQDNQKWRLNPRPDGQYEIRNIHSKLCLDVQGDSRANGALVHQWTCHNGPNQSFLLEPQGPGKYRIRVVSSNKCLDIRGVSTANGALLQQWDCAPSQANQTFAILEPGDYQNDPENCGYAGHSCQGGACFEGTCQASVIANDFQCSSGMSADESYAYVGDVGGLYRYDLNGYNKTLLMSQEPGHYFNDLAKDDGQFFWGDFDKARRLNAGQTASAALTDFPISQLAVNGNNVIGLDYPQNRFVSVDRNQTAPGTVKAIHTVPAGEYPMYSAVSSAYIYYVTGNSAGSTVWQVNRSTGIRKSLNGPGESVFGLVVFNETAYWSYRTAEGTSGIRRLSPLPGQAVQEAVPTTGSMQGVGNPMVDGSGIYHSWYDGVSSGFYRTPHNNATIRTIVSKGYTWPYDARYVRFTSTSMLWLQTCNRGGGGLLFRLAKP